MEDFQIFSINYMYMLGAFDNSVLIWTYTLMNKYSLIIKRSQMVLLFGLLVTRLGDSDESAAYVLM